MSLFHKKSKVETTDINKRFDLICRVGQGSMSKVWRADDQLNGRFVAVKLLDKEKTARYEARFKGLKKPHEGDIALSLHHPNIVRTYEIGYTPEDEVFLVMEYVEGCGLSLLVDLQSDRMRRYRTRYMIQIGEALAYFHRQHWIHRDICPRNIMVTEENDIKLIDFGLTVPDTPDFRKPGNRTGTANYMAPELIKRQSTDQRIDVFSYAVTCFEMYTKRHPWDAAMTIDAVLQHINKPPIPIRELVPRIDPEIADIIMKGLEANPAERWQTMDDMVKQFRKAEARLVMATRELLDNRKKAAAGGNGAKQAGPAGKKKTQPGSDAAGTTKPSAVVVPPPMDDSSVPAVPGPGIESDTTANSNPTIESDTAADSGPDLTPDLAAARKAGGKDAAPDVVANGRTAKKSTTEGVLPATAPIEEAAPAAGSAAEPDVSPVRSGTDAAGPAADPARSAEATADADDDLDDDDEILSLD
ncbi:MAG: protein kinase [Fuerstiella sp.]